VFRKIAYYTSLRFAFPDQIYGTLLGTDVLTQKADRIRAGQMIGAWYEAAREQSRRAEVDEQTSGLVNRKKLRALQLLNAAQSTPGLLSHSEYNGFCQSQRYLPPKSTGLKDRTITALCPEISSFSRKITELFIRFI
jgi:hypothetical protein